MRLLQLSASLLLLGTLTGALPASNTAKPTAEPAEPLPTVEEDDQKPANRTKKQTTTFCVEIKNDPRGGLTQVDCGPQIPQVPQPVPAPAPAPAPEPESETFIVIPQEPPHDTVEFIQVPIVHHHVPVAPHLIVKPGHAHGHPHGHGHHIHVPPAPAPAPPPPPPPPPPAPAPAPVDPCPPGGSSGGPGGTSVIIIPGGGGPGSGGSGSGGPGAGGGDPCPPCPCLPGSGSAQLFRDASGGQPGVEMMPMAMDPAMMMMMMMRPGVDGRSANMMMPMGMDAPGMMIPGGMGPMSVGMGPMPSSITMPAVPAMEMRMAPMEPMPEMRSHIALPTLHGSSGSYHVIKCGPNGLPITSPVTYSMRDMTPGSGLSVIPSMETPRTSSIQYTAPHITITPAHTSSISSHGHSAVHLAHPCVDGHARSADMMMRHFHHPRSADQAKETADSTPLPPAQDVTAQTASATSAAPAAVAPEAAGKLTPSQMLSRMRGLSPAQVIASPQSSSTQEAAESPVQMSVFTPGGQKVLLGAAKSALEEENAEGRREELTKREAEVAENEVV